MDKIEKIRAEIERQMKYYDEKEMKAWDDSEQGDEDALWYQGHRKMCAKLLAFIDSLQQEQQMPDSTQLIAEWEREKAVLEQKDFRGDAERMAYNAFLDGFVKGLGYEGTK